MSVLAGAVQPPLMTLLSSSSHPSISPLWTTHTDPSLPSDSFITTLPDTSYGSEAEASSSSRAYVPKHPSRGEIVGSVIHVQSPTVGTTYLQCGESLTEYRRRVDKGKARAGEGPMPLGIELGWVGLQVRRLGRREFAFEIGLVDTKGREGIVRCSSFKKSPTVHPHRSPPLIHLPLTLPAATPSTLTPWLHISLNLVPLIALFHSLPRPQLGDTSPDSPERPQKRRRLVELPSGQLKSVSYVRLYANCRVRRIWFSEEGERTLGAMGRGVEDEWGLYAAEGPA
ncbi:hypothetical protein JCM24511_06485 [Saitozyma sp. JCM 24511]|nr:hypothetical protein JCM24511_06485 [Saitozyma sp. JCM 24511]